MMNRLVVEVCEVLLGGGAVGIFFVTVSERLLLDGGTASNRCLKTLRIFMLPVCRRFGGAAL